MDEYLVNSSNLQSVYYDPLSGTLIITFRNGSVYAYYGVPAAVNHGLRVASSPGGFHHAFIKNSYPYRRLQ